jgi:hypothetical protein
MTNKTANLGAILLALCAFSSGVPVWAQPAIVTADASAVHARCTKVFLTSDTPLMPVRLAAPYLQHREDFQASKLVFAEEEGSADVIVRLGLSGEHNTSVLVVNRDTGEHSVGTSAWTDYPGMIALDVMKELRQVCHGSVVPPAAPRRIVREDGEPAPALRAINAIAACSRTSWMDTRELSQALSSSDELKRWSIQITPGCKWAQTRLEVTHNLEQTTEWTWTLQSPDSTTLASGRVVAFTSRDAAQRIASGLVREVGHRSDDSPGHSSAVATSVSRKEIPSRMVRVRIMPMDFSMFDTRIVLSLDSEKISATDVNGRQVFSFGTEELRDVRHQRAWDPMFDLGAPPALISAWDHAGNQLFEPVTIGGIDLPVDHRPQFLAYTATLTGLFGVEIVLSPIKTPVEILELVWEHDGQVRTVSLQVPRKESGRLLHTLRDATYSVPVP